MPSGRPTLLLADDSPTIQKVVSLTFEDELEVVAVSDGAEALRLLETRTPPDILLADVWMPGPGGYELCEHVKRDARLRHIPVVLLVGTFEPFNEAEARRVGADIVLSKPFQSIRDLVSKVGSLLGGGEKKRDDAEQSPRAEPAEETMTRHADVPMQRAHAEATVERSARDEASAQDSFAADLGADDQLIEAKPADAFGAARLSEAWREPAAHEEPAAPASETREPLMTQEPLTSEESNAARMQATEAFVEPRVEEVAQHEQSFASNENSFAPREQSFASSARESGEPAFAAQSSFAARAGASGAADDALLDLGQFQPTPAYTAQESDDFELDIDLDEPAHAWHASHEARDFDAASYDQQPAAQMHADAASAFAEASHGAPASFDEPVSYGEPSASFDESASSYGERSSSFAPSESPASVWEEQETTPTEVVMQDEPQTFSQHEVLDARGGFVEPSVVPASEPPASPVEFTDGSVEGDVAKAPRVDYTTQPVAGEPSREPQAPPAPERFVPSEASAEGFAVGEARAGLEEPLRADQLSPEAIDKIARRVVELMSDKVVREVAWEVVPELAELLIKQKLEEEGKQ